MNVPQSDTEVGKVPAFRQFRIVTWMFDPETCDMKPPQYSALFVMAPVKRQSAIRMSQLYVPQ